MPTPSVEASVPASLHMQSCGPAPCWNERHQAAVRVMAPPMHRALLETSVALDKDAFRSSSPPGRANLQAWRVSDGMHASESRDNKENAGSPAASPNGLVRRLNAMTQDEDDSNGEKGNSPLKEARNEMRSRRQSITNSTEAMKLLQSNLMHGPMPLGVHLPLDAVVGEDSDKKLMPPEKGAQRFGREASPSTSRPDSEQSTAAPAKPHKNPVVARPRRASLLGIGEDSPVIAELSAERVARRKSSLVGLDQEDFLPRRLSPA